MLASKKLGTRVQIYMPALLVCLKQQPKLLWLVQLSVQVQHVWLQIPCPAGLCRDSSGH